MTTIQTLPENRSATALLSGILAAFEQGLIRPIGPDFGAIIVPPGGRMLLYYALKRGDCESAIPKNFMYREYRHGPKDGGYLLKNQLAEINGVKLIENDYFCRVEHVADGRKRTNIVCDINEQTYLSDTVAASMNL